MHPVVALVTAGVEMDVLGLSYAEYSDAERVLRPGMVSTAPADQPYHLIELRFFTFDSGIGAKQRPFHGSIAAAG